MTAYCATAPASPQSSERIVLRDGSSVLVRPVEPGDGQLLLDGFARLSVESRRLRFLAGKPYLSAAEVRFFTDVDHCDHEAIGALDPCEGRGVGVARYVRSAHDPQVAEMALTVVDDWHGRGLGTELLARLVDRARTAGIYSFTAVVSMDNAAMIGLLRRAKAGVELTSIDIDTLEYQIALRAFATSLQRVLITGS